MKNIVVTFVVALADHLIWSGNKENIADEIKLKLVFLVIMRLMKNIVKIVNAPNNIEVYIAIRLLMPNKLNTILNMNGQPIDFG